MRLARALLLDSRPCVAKRNGPVENQMVVGRVRVQAKIPLTLELNTFTNRSVLERRFYFATE